MAGSPNEDPEGSRITYVKGDLFACPKTDSLAHCISEDCRMGAGIAVLFKKKFGGVQELISQLGGTWPDPEEALGGDSVLD
nr:O-acetyl-ADP-ribose deacetylase 1 isoform X2 [Equus caballus]